VSIAHRALHSETLNIEEAGVDEERSVTSGAEDRKRALDRENDETIEDALLCFIEVNDGEAIADNRMNQVFDELTH
jgi:hypothetical protein